MSGALYHTVNGVFPGSEVTLEDFRMQRRPPFSWDIPEQTHTEITTPGQWWEALNPILIHCFTDVGFLTEEALRLASRFPTVYTDPAYWVLFEDTLPTLRKLAAGGYLNVILSNHVPELETIVSNLGIREFFRDVFSSALIGYEKPHPEAYEYVRRNIGDGYRFVMIGDSPKPDVAGPEAAGMEAILVRGHHKTAKKSVGDLTELPSLLDEILRQG